MDQLEVQEEDKTPKTIEEFKEQINKIRGQLIPNPEAVSSIDYIILTTKLPMYVKDPELKESGISSYVIYKFLGSSITTAGLTRRYSEFYSLRETLIKRWKGLYIPGMPPKKAIGNKDKVLIATRCRLLNSFCRRIAKIPYLMNSEEVKIFISNTKDIPKSLDKLPKRTYKDIYESYKQLYPNYYETYDLILGKGKVGNFQNFAKSLLHSIKVKAYINLSLDI